MGFLNITLDLGFDYGADGGPDDFGTDIVMVSGAGFANQRHERPMGEWELGSRNVTRNRLDYLLRFWHSVRGRAYVFRYKDWTDYRASSEPLALNGTASTQLIKTYGGLGNDYVATILLPLPSSVVLELNQGAGWIVQAEGADYTINDQTGVVTWLGTPPDPETDLARWSGEFHRRVRFGVQRLRAQFVAYERRDGGDQAIYSLGALTVREERGP